MKERLEVIQKIFNKINGKTYVEVGVRFGCVFLRMIAPRKIGIDPRFQIPLLKKLFFFRGFFSNEYFEKTSDDFFVQDANEFEKGKIDVAFIDGWHTYDQSLKDFKNCLNHLSEKGVIILHDCNPTTPEMASEKSAWEVWKTIVYIRSNYKDLNAFVLDRDYGMGIILRGNQENPLSFTPEEIKSMTYADLEKNRKNFLNLKSSDYFDQFLNTLS